MSSLTFLRISTVAATAATSLQPSLTSSIPTLVTSAASQATASARPGAENGECRLLGPFAILVQGALGTLAILSLVFKRWRERPQRPWKVWAFDVSKQVLGTVLLHLLNLLMSMVSSGQFKVSINAVAEVSESVETPPDYKPNPCSWYFLNLALDTTIGIPILISLLKVLFVGASYTPLANPPGSLVSGNYGEPPKVTWWLKQSMLYFLGLIGMKACVYGLFQLLPWLGKVGDWALRWTEGNEALQITFVMFLFPLIMNAVQYYIIDIFIKKNNKGEDAAKVADENDEAATDEHGRLLASDDDQASLISDEEIRKPAADGKTKSASRIRQVSYDADKDLESNGSAEGSDGVNCSY